MTIDDDDDEAAVGSSRASYNLTYYGAATPRECFMQPRAGGMGCHR